MERGTLKFIVDLILLLSFLGMLITGILKWPGLANSLGLNIDFSLYSKIHDYSGLILALGVILHFILNWEEFICIMKNLFKKEGECESDELRE